MGDLTANFSLSEFTCKCGCGADHIEIKLVEHLQKVRETLQRPLIITSGVRCHEHNHAIGGLQDSAHMTGFAADIKCSNSRDRNELLIESLKYFDRIGVYREFIHVDIDKSKIQNVIWVY